MAGRLHKSGSHHRQTTRYRENRYGAEFNAPTGEEISRRKAPSFKPRTMGTDLHNPFAGSIATNARLYSSL